MEFPISLYSCPNKSTGHLRTTRRVTSRPAVAFAAGGSCVATHTSSCTSTQIYDMDSLCVLVTHSTCTGLNCSRIYHLSFPFSSSCATLGSLPFYCAGVSCVFFTRPHDDPRNDTLHMSGVLTRNIMAWETAARGGAEGGRR